MAGRTGDSGVREGASLGLVVAIATWIWVALVGALAGRPLHMFDVLGGVAVFTVIHCFLNILYGIVIVSAVRGATRAPSLIIALIFGLVMMEVGFAMLSVMLGQAGLGSLSWVLIFGGSVLGLAIMVHMLSRRHPLAQLLHEAEAER